MKLSRSDFLKSMGVVGFSAFFGGDQPPEPTEHTVYLPAVSNCGSSDYAKLVEYAVPFGHISPGFTFVDFPSCSKYILECTARMKSEMGWMPWIRFNDNRNSVYQQGQFLTWGDIDAIANDDNCFDRVWLANVIPPDDDDFPYSFKMEVQNIGEMYKWYSVRGTAGTSTSRIVVFQISGVFKSIKPIEQIDLGINYPTGFFNSDSVVALYGVK